MAKLNITISIDYDLKDMVDEVKEFMEENPDIEGDMLDEAIDDIIYGYFDPDEPESAYLGRKERNIIAKKIKEKL